MFESELGHFRDPGNATKFEGTLLYQRPMVSYLEHKIKKANSSEGKAFVKKHKVTDPYTVSNYLNNNEFDGFLLKRKLSYKPKKPTSQSMFKRADTMTQIYLQ